MGDPTELCFLSLVLIPAADREASGTRPVLQRELDRTRLVELDGSSGAAPPSAPTPPARSPRPQTPPSPA